MITLTYEPAFDPYHTMFRVVRLRELLGQKPSLATDHARIVDYFLLFPARASIVKTLRPHISLKNRAVAAASSRQYGKQPDDRAVFSRMRSIQQAAYETLANRDFLDSDALAGGELAFTAKGFPPELKKRAADLNNVESDASKLVAALANDYELLGIDGLKARTGLLEFRYDAV